MAAGQGRRARLPGRASACRRSADRMAGGWRAAGPWRVGLRGARRTRQQLCAEDDGVVLEEVEGEVEAILEEVPEIESSDSEDENLVPLKEALDRAKALALSSSFKREALEAEAQGVAELAVEARDAFKRSSKKLEEAMSEKKAFAIEIQDLEERKEQLDARILEIKKVKEVEADDAQIDGEEAVSRLEGGLNLSSAEWISEYDESAEAEDVAASLQASADLNEELKIVRIDIETASNRIAKLRSLQEEQESKSACNITTFAFHTM
eukprot:evm.model.scf_1423.2 EVM.evm.TU.scf_1423.2   scf_1423:22984-26478(-)